MATRPNFEGFDYSHKSVEVKVDGVVYTAVKEFTCDDGVEVGLGRGNNQQVVVRTRGDYDCNAMLEMYQVEGDEMIARLGKRLYSKSFDVVEVFSEDGLPTRERTARGCLITKIEFGSTEGNEPNTVKFTLKPMYILRDGEPPFPGLRQG